MQYHEAAAWFELGRRWFKAHYGCMPPVWSPEERKRAFLDFCEMAATLSLPIPTGVPDPERVPKQFNSQASAIYDRVRTSAQIARGNTHSMLLQIGVTYSFLAHSAPRAISGKPDSADFEKAMKDLGVSNSETRAFMKKLHEFRSLAKRTSSGEHELALELGGILAKTTSAQSGIQVGEAILPNTILLPSKVQLILPKRLVGFKKEIESFLKKHSYERNVFLMMPFRDATTKLRTGIRAICAKYKLHLVVADENRIVENDLNSNVLACLLACKFGIAVFSRPESQQTINPNVSYELGMMHRDDKVCLILKDRRLKSLPSDLIGYLYTEYSTTDSQSITSHVELWIQDRVIGSA